MTFFPNGKLNIGLWVVSKRSDGFHNIETIFYPVGIKDACEFVVQDNGSDSDELTTTGLNPGSAMADNLVIRAINILRRSYNLPALRIHLHKAIPIGSGLGGGSSDASFMLRYLNRYFRIGLCNNELRKLAGKIGSDCPFFIENSPAYATGRGEVLKRVKPLLEGKHIMVVNPGIHIDTGEAYSSLHPSTRAESLDQLYTKPISEWPGIIDNDFEPAVFKLYPMIGEIKNELYKSGAIYSSMSGSGSSVFGIFDSEPPAGLFPDYWQWRGVL